VSQLRKALGSLAAIVAVIALFPSPASATSCVLLEDPVNGVKCMVFTEPAVQAVCAKTVLC
jgi:hypothetical protein